MSKVALLSVYDKTGIVEFAKGLSELGFTIISTGGTAALLTKNGLKVKNVEEITNYPEMLNGRVKTIHPNILSAILADRDKINHMEELKKLNLQPIDLVVVNLYPFENCAIENIRRGIMQVTEEIIENIDIGGVNLLRAAAKNYKHVLPICDNKDYNEVLQRLHENKLDIEYRLKMASKTLRYIAYYDSLIASYFTDEEFPEIYSIPIHRMSIPRYGENPHQSAGVYEIKTIDGLRTGISSKISILQGKELSYNNYLDINAAWELVSEFEESACTIIKHTNPCGVATGTNSFEVYTRALACDEISAFGGIVGFNCEVDEKTASKILEIFTECVIAKGYTEEALEIFKQKKDIRVLTAKSTAGMRTTYKSVGNLMLVQQSDDVLYEKLKVVTEHQPTEEQMKDLIFAYKVCKHVKSNAIVLAQDRATVGIGAGQMSRIDALCIAIMKSKQAKNYDLSRPIVMASDAFFPFPDVVEKAYEAGVVAIIQPGGSIRDEESIKKCNELGISMVFTGTRHFKH